MEIVHSVALERFEEIRGLDEADRKFAADFDDLELFLFGKDSRTYCVLLTSFLEDALKQTFAKQWNIEDKKASDLYFGSNGPLSSFSQRALVAVGVGWLSEDERHEADVLRKIRNEFSHNHRVRELTDKKIAGLVSTLPLHEHIFSEEMRDYKQALEKTELQAQLRLRLFCSHAFITSSILRRSKMIAGGIPPISNRDGVHGLTELEGRFGDCIVRHCFRVARFGNFADTE